VDWFKMESRIATNPKIDELSDGAYRALTYLWGHAMCHETGGQVPLTAPRLIPRVTAGRLRELEFHGFIHENGSGWVLHDWEHHQSEALSVQEKKRLDAARKRAEREAGTHLYSSEWRRTRKAVFDRDGGKCITCGLVTDNWDADHEPPAKQLLSEGKDLNDLANIRTMCHSCHSKKTMRTRNKKPADDPGRGADIYRT
jgi:5-methylcytosine-specific restriction endonuclease McrA